MISKGKAKEEDFVYCSCADESTINHGGTKEKREKETRSAATKERNELSLIKASNQEELVTTCTTPSSTTINNNYQAFQQEHEDILESTRTGFHNIVARLQKVAVLFVAVKTSWESAEEWGEKYVEQSPLLDLFLLNVDTGKIGRV
jgi:hypothetical protein